MVINVNTLSRLCSGFGLKISGSFDARKDENMPRVKREAFPQRLVRLRNAKGWTQMELADKSGISRRMIAYYETKLRNLPPDSLIRLANALKVSVDELMGYRVPTQKEPPVRNRTLLKKLKALDRFSLEDQKKIIGHIDDIGTKYKTAK
jgi:transcriptional regulator with XRE-family HTH domain